MASEPEILYPLWVYVDVVFDLFHWGHVEFLRNARALGDLLIVGLVSDEDVASYKPAPIMSFVERRDVVQACRFVDRVIESPVPLHCTGEFLDSIGASIVCHGDDMTDDELRFWYGPLVDSGRLRTVPYSKEISSRSIVQRVARRLRDGSLRESL